MNARILIVEDNVDLAENLAELFAEEGCQVALAHDANEAALRSHDGPFDVIALDVSLGRTSGLDLIPLLHERSRDAELIVMTGNASLDSAMRAIDRGVFAYVQKPFGPEQILSLAERAFGQVRLRREKAELQQRLLASEALYRDVVETVDACILGLDRDGIIRFANQHSVRCTARRMQRLVGAPLATLWGEPEDDASPELHWLIEQALKGSTQREIERTLARPDGARRTVRWTLAKLAQQPVSDKDGSEREACVLAVGQDVTERVDLERRHAQDQALAAMGTLTSGLAHEIRNPLNAAKLQLELLSRRAKRLTEPAVASQLTATAEIVQAEIAGLSVLLDEFLQLARPRALENLSVDVGELIREVSELQRPVAEAAGIELETHSEAQVRVRGDRARLRQVLLNLITNAIEAMRDRGCGRVSLRAEWWGEQQVRIAVQDDGPGISPEIRETLFEPFVTNREAGTGLGLSIVKSLVEGHGGRVRLSDGPSGGALAEILLPAAKAARAL